MHCVHKPPPHVDHQQMNAYLRVRNIAHCSVTTEYRNKRAVAGHASHEDEKEQHGHHIGFGSFRIRRVLVGVLHREDATAIGVIVGRVECKHRHRAQCSVLNVAHLSGEMIEAETFRIYV